MACVQFAKLRVVIQSAGGEAVMCDDDRPPSDDDLLADNACIMCSDVSQNSNPRNHSWIKHIQQLLIRFLSSFFYFNISYGFFCCSQVVQTPD